MTNEDLAIQIQLGHNEYYPILWDKVKNLLTKILYSTIKYYPLPNYITTDDLEQELYFAYCLAVQAFDSFKPFLFNSYLNFSVKRVLAKALYKAPINEVSYNQKVSTDNADSEQNEMIDLLEDESSGAYIEKLEVSELQRTVRQAIAELPNKESQVIYLHYIKNKGYDEISKILGADKKRLRNWKENGLNMLSKNRSIRAEYYSMIEHYSGKENENTFIYKNPFLLVEPDLLVS